MQAISNIFVLYPEKNRFSSNTYLIIGKEPLLIDPGSHSKEYLQKFLIENGLNFGDIKKIILTHAHADHFSSGQYFKNAIFYISEEDGQYLKTRDNFYTMSEFFANKFYPENLKYIKEDDFFDLGCQKLFVIITPGHTLGGLCLYDKENSLLFSGDILFEDSCGRFDLISSDKNSVIDSLKKLQQINFKILLSGHGMVFTSSKEDQKENITQILKQIK